MPAASQVVLAATQFASSPTFVISIASRLALSRNQHAIVRRGRRLPRGIRAGVEQIRWCDGTAKSASGDQAGRLRVEAGPELGRGRVVDLALRVDRRLLGVRTRTAVGLPVAARVDARRLVRDGRLPADRDADRPVRVGSSSVSNRAHASPVLPPLMPVSSHFHVTKNSVAVSLVACPVRSFCPGASFAPATSFVNAENAGALNDVSPDTDAPADGAKAIAAIATRTTHVACVFIVPPSGRVHCPA